MNESTLNNFEDFYKKINPKMNEDSASCLIGITMETEGAKDFYKGEGGSRKKIAEQFPFPALRKRTKLGGALVSQGGYRTMVKNLIKKHGGNPDLWEPKQASGMNHKTGSVMESTDGETQYLRLYYKSRKTDCVNVKYRFSDNSETEKNDERFEKWMKPAKKSWIPKWITEIGITDEQKLVDFMEEFDRIKVLSVKSENVVRLKAGDFNYDREKNKQV